MHWKTAAKTFANLFTVLAIGALCLAGHFFKGKAPLTQPAGASALTDADTHFAASRWERTEEVGIQEAVFRCQLRQEEAKSAPICFLSATGDSPTLTPDMAVLRRLAREGYHVAPSLRATYRPDAVLRDRATGKPGVSLEQTAIRWVGPREVQVDGSRYESPDRESSAVYCLVCRAGVWRVAVVAPFSS